MSLSYSLDKNVTSQIRYRKVFNILIVDDDEVIAKNLKEVLSMRGHNVYIFEDGLRCISHFQNNDVIKYDIVFMDYHMDGLDGAQVAEIVKENKANTIIFAYTGDDSTKAINDFKNVGMNGVIIKPFDISCIDMLMNKLESCDKLDSVSIKMITKKSLKSILIFDEILNIE